MRFEQEHLASRLEEIARPGEAGDRERIVAYALRYGSETLTDDEALAEARHRLGERQNGRGGAEDGPFALPLDDFIADKRDAPEPLLGTQDDNILPAHGLGLVIGKGGKGKTTFVVDLCLHLASGVDYLGLKVERPLNILLIENEGPREPFRRKLERKLESWPHEIKGLIAIHTENWGLARLDLPGFVDRLNAYCTGHEIHLVVGDPLDSLGMDGEGSPSETRAMVDRFKAGGLFTERAWLLPHHSRKESVEDAVDEAAGAWGGRPDAMLTLEKKSENQARLSFAKVRWQERERRPYILDFDPETDSFTFVKEEQGEERDYAVEIEEYLAEHPHQTVKEISLAIQASADKVRETLEAHPDRFRLRTREEAKAVDRHPSSKVWAKVTWGQKSPESPSFSQGELEGRMDRGDS